MPVQDHEFEIRELHARQECEGLGVIGKTGRPDHGFNQLLRECFYYYTGTSKVHWQATLRMRKDMIVGYERMKERG